MNWMNSGLRCGVSIHTSSSGAILKRSMWESFGITESDDSGIGPIVYQSFKGFTM